MPSHIFCRLEFVDVTNFDSRCLDDAPSGGASFGMKATRAKQKQLLLLGSGETEVFLFGSTLLGMHPGQMDDSTSDCEVADNTNLLFQTQLSVGIATSEKMQSALACFNYILHQRWTDDHLEYKLHQPIKISFRQAKKRSKWIIRSDRIIWFFTFGRACVYRKNEYRVVVERFMHLSLAPTVSVQVSGSKRHKYLAGHKTRRAAPGSLFPFNIC